MVYSLLQLYDTKGAFTNMFWVQKHLDRARDNVSRSVMYSGTECMVVKVFIQKWKFCHHLHKQNTMTFFSETRRETFWRMSWSVFKWQLMVTDVKHLKGCKITLKWHKRYKGLKRTTVYPNSQGWSTVFLREDWGMK